MRSEECVCKEPIESLHLPRLGQLSSGGNGSAELYFCAYKTSEEYVRGMCARMCVEKDVLRGLRILYQPVHRRSSLKVEVRKIDMDNWKRRYFYINAHFHSSARHPRRHIFIAQLW
jgi:hypothetical protein